MSTISLHAAAVVIWSLLPLGPAPASLAAELASQAPEQLGNTAYEAADGTARLPTAGLLPDSAGSQVDVPPVKDEEAVIGGDVGPELTGQQLEQEDTGASDSPERSDQQREASEAEDGAAETDAESAVEGATDEQTDEAAEEAQQGAPEDAPGDATQDAPDQRPDDQPDDQPGEEANDRSAEPARGTDQSPPQELPQAEPAPASSMASVFLQGEYEGPSRWFRLPDGWRHNYAGLQVVAEGDGRFFAVFYPGGLPGTGWSRQWKARLRGQRQGDSVQLEGDALRVVVQSARAHISTTDGRRLAVLDRVLRRSGTLGAAPPPGAIVLFDGSDTEQFRGGRINQAGNLAAGAQVKDVFEDYTLHLEFRLPFEPDARAQGRGNSGVYLQSRYEVQILDSFGLEGEFNECGSLYRLRAPDVNMCLPPNRWQTYDITFRSPRFNADGNKVQNARVTVRHNNVVIHDKVEVERKTGAGQREGPEPLPIKLQDHGDPVEFRNIWIVDDSRRLPALRPPW